MANTATTYAPLGAASILHSAETVSQVYYTVLNWNQNRKTRKALSRLTDAQLEDIGLDRADIANI